MAKKKLTPKQVKALVAKEEKKADKSGLKIFKGGYLVAAKNREKAEDISGRVSETESQVLLLNPKQEISAAAARRSVVRGRTKLRITPKTPRLRK